MRTLTSGTLTVQAYDANVWLQERNVLRIKDTGATKVSVGLNPAQGFATYTLDANHEAVVDMSDYIRTHATATDIYVRSNSGSAVYVNANYTPVGLINPKNVLIPETDNGWPMTVPSMYRQAFAGAAYRIGVELCASEYAVAYGSNGTVEIAFQLEPWEPMIVSDLDNMQTVVTATQDGHNTYQIKELNPCARHAAVRWVSFTGKTRLHTFEVRDLSQTADEVIKLETLDGSYNQIKGRTDGFKLYLDDLTAYDYWYYSDIITSSKVEVSLDGITWNQVEVTTKSVTIPNTSEGKTNKLEIAVNWRNYDAVTM